VSDGRVARRHALTVTGVALAARLLVVAWAARLIPPAADGTYYHVLAKRIAAGQGYTWAWPDGVVTHAAHYPVGYPGVVGLAYALFGATPVVAMLVNAVLGTAGAWAAHDLLRRATSPRLALGGGLAAALHPALVPYTAAMMTEGVTAAASILAIALAARAKDATRSQGKEASRSGLPWLVACGVVMGLATLVRPQVIAVAPAIGWLAAGADKGTLARVARLATVTALALIVCTPWTVRNCMRMEKCALVSVNGGWNLAIGAQTVTGSWQELTVPEACKEVFAEAAKDDCFGREARRVILAEPGAWLARVPAKLRVTFDYFGAAPWYLHAANPVSFPYGAKLWLGAFETITSRLLLVAALVAVRTIAGPRRLLREAVTGIGLLSCFLTAGALGYVACGAAVLLLGRKELERIPMVVPASALVLLVTAVMHSVFFGAGRYGLMVVPFVTALAFVRLAAPSRSTT
jgi:4-amino-4-deoxy-L-arabinose transferase-like glycosyltransferase